MSMLIFGGSVKVQYALTLRLEMMSENCFQPKTPLCRIMSPPCSVLCPLKTNNLCPAESQSSVLIYNEIEESAFVIVIDSYIYCNYSKMLY